jgi:hypothetical protein
MAINPSSFHRINVVDSCSVWNILSSKLLYAATKDSKCDFCVTSFVHYECLVKARKSILPCEQELMDRLSAEQTKGAFQKHSCDIGDLQEIALLENRQRLGKGELSSIAFAMKIRQAFLTDDKKARRLSKDSGNRLTQTTPHLLSWLRFTSRLGDSDVTVVIDQHMEMGRPLAPHFETAHRMALECLINTTVGKFLDSGAMK